MKTFFNLLKDADIQKVMDLWVLLYSHSEDSEELPAEFIPSYIKYLKKIQPDEHFYNFVTCLEETPGNFTLIGVERDQPEDFYGKSESFWLGLPVEFEGISAEEAICHIIFYINFSKQC